MNGQLMELWGRWMTAALQGQNQVDMMNGGWLRNFQNMSQMSQSFGFPWTMPMNTMSGNTFFNGWRQAWEPLLNLQKLSLQWMAMVPKAKYEALEDHCASLENKVQEQTRTIERMQELLSKTSGENNVVVTQMQDLISQQTQQFKQLTTSVGDYIKSSTKEMAAKK